MKLILCFAFAFAALAQTSPRITVGTDAPQANNCQLLQIGDIYVRSEDASNGPINVSRCTQTGSNTYQWQPVDHFAGTTLPAKCATGDIAFKTDATAGSNLYGCTAANTWTAQAGGGGSGTVTTVGFTGGLLSVATPTTTPAITVAGTSGGVPYFASTSTWASSGALTANLPVIGGGAGAAPSVGTRSGNTTAFVTTTGTQTSGRCVEIDASGNHIASSGACGGTSSAANGVVDFGQLGYGGNAADTSMITANMWVLRLHIPVGGWTFTNASMDVVTAQASSHVIVGFYNGACSSKIGQWTFDTSATGGVAATSPASITLPEGEANLAIVSDTASVVVKGRLIDSSILLALNATATVVVGFSANTQTAGTLPATCGALTAGGGITAAPAVIGFP